MADSPTASGRCWAIMDKPGVELYHVELTFRAWRSEVAFVAVCDELGVASQGDSLGEAIDNSTDATILYLNTIEATGQRRRIFDERGLVPELGMPEVAANDTHPGRQHLNESVATVHVELREAATAARG